MAEYLSKEEIKQWRSSLERITLEEYAARLGKTIEQEKHTNDIIDIALKGNPVISQEEDWKQSKVERINSIAERAFEREREIAPSPFSAENIKNKEKPVKKDELKSLTKRIKVITEKETKKTKEVKETKQVKQVKEIKKETKKISEAKKVKKPKTESKNVKKAEKQIKETKKTKISENDKKVKTPKVSAKKENKKVSDTKIAFNKALTDREQKVFDYFSENCNQIVYAKDLATLLELPRDYVYKYIKNLREKIEGGKLQNADKGGFILTI